MSKDIYKLLGVAGATVTGVYAATMTAVSRQQEINANKEIALNRLEQEKVLAEEKLALDKERLVFDKEKFEFDKLKVSDLNDTRPGASPVGQEGPALPGFKSTCNNASENLNTSNADSFNINSTLESSNLVVENMSLTFICFTSVTIVLTISLTFNYLTKMYGDTLLYKLPRIFHPLYNFYNKYLLFSNLFNLSIILLCQSVGLLLCLFLYLN